MNIEELEKRLLTLQAFVKLNATSLRWFGKMLQKQNHLHAKQRNFNV